jgi:serine/threonine protein kinase
LNNSKLF